MSDDKISALLSDDRYESKDWKQADLAGRIEWLIFMLKAKGEEVENMVRLAEPMLSDALAAADKRIEELEGQLQSVLDRETSILRYYDAKLDAADAKQLQQVLAMPEIAVLVDALCKSAEGWDNVIGMGLIAKKHFGSARVLRDEAFEALQRVWVKP